VETNNRIAAEKIRGLEGKMQSLVKRDNPSEPDLNPSSFGDKSVDENNWDKRNDQIVQVNRNAQNYNYDQTDYDKPERKRSNR